MREPFRRFAQHVARVSGSFGAFSAACLVILIWAVTGPLFGFSDTWQLVINTGTTIVTFLMVFLIQNTQNRDAQAFHAKLDELVLKLRAADNRLIEAEELSDQELDELHRGYLDAAANEAKRSPPLNNERPGSSPRRVRRQNGGP